MLDLLYPMGMVTLSWFLFFVLFAGLGGIVLRLIGQPSYTSDSWFDSFWLGWCFSLAFLQLWHFVFAVNDTVLILLALISAASLYFQWHRIAPAIRQLKIGRRNLLVFVLALLWMSNRAIEMPNAFDTGFRDIQAVMWIDSYPAVPGLNNLFSSLAYNHSVYLYDALLDVSHWSARSFHIATGLLIVVMVAKSLQAAKRLYSCRDGRGVRWSWVFAALFLPYLMFYTLGRGGITHFLTDTAVDLVGILALIYLLDFVQEFHPVGNPDYYLVLRLAIVIVTGVTIKQTFVVFGLSVACFAIAVWMIRGGLRSDIQRFTQIALTLVFLVLIMIVPWMMRGVITSGYIAYPLSFGRVEVDWAESKEFMRERQQRLATNTRRRYGDPEVVLASWDWVGPWFNSFSGNITAFTLPASLTLGALALYVVGRIRNRGRQDGSRLELWILLPLIVMLIFWFYSLPNIKYVRYVLWSSASLSILLAMLAWPSMMWRFRLAGMSAVLAISLLYGLYLVIAQGSFPLPAGPVDGFYTHALPPINVFETDSGLQLNMPHSHIRQCWQIPLPCAPYPRSGVYARVPGQLEYGFGYDPGSGEDGANQ